MSLTDTRPSENELSILLLRSDRYELQQPINNRLGSSDFLRQVTVEAYLDSVSIGSVSTTQENISSTEQGSLVRINHIDVVRDFREHGVGTALLGAALKPFKDKPRNSVRMASDIPPEWLNKRCLYRGCGQVEFSSVCIQSVWEMCNRRNEFFGNLRYRIIDSAE